MTLRSTCLECREASTGRCARHREPEAAPFERTTCDCPECVRCCHEQPGSLAAGEVERIAAYLGKPVAAVLHKFWASPGALALKDGVAYRIGTITPQLQRGRCVFLGEDDRCTIHPVAPAGCALFDTHMQAAEAQPRSQWLVRTQCAPEYQSLRRTLPAATSHKPRGY